MAETAGTLPLAHAHMSGLMRKPWSVQLGVGGGAAPEDDDEEEEEEEEAAAWAADADDDEPPADPRAPGPLVSTADAPPPTAPWVLRSAGKWEERENVEPGTGPTWRKAFQ